ncbi:MAG TPA: aconitate hydratase AcnA [Gemmatimonadota bacterium]|jgi:aconitate hydratase
MRDTFGSRSVLRSAGGDVDVFRLDALERRGVPLARLPYALRVLLENLLRHEDGTGVTADDVLALAGWDPASEPAREIGFTPARVLLQDFTGVPAVVDLAAMRAAMARLGGDPARIDPLQPVDLVIDHSVQVDRFGTPEALAFNAEMDYRRNAERYAFLRWGQHAFRNLRVVPPATGIVHQVNLEYLARVVWTSEPAGGGRTVAYPDTLVGTDSHTTMINGLGVLGWGVGGIEAEAAMLGQPVSMLIPKVVGFRLTGELAEGATATDLVLTVTEILRAHGVVGKFVEFHGPGLAALPLADRATIGNMAPEYGATCGIFPIDDETLRYLRFTGRPSALVGLVEAYAKEQGLFHGPATTPASYSELLELDLATVEPSLAGPRRPQDRVRLGDVGRTFEEALPSMRAASAPPPVPNAGRWEGEGGAPANGGVAVAARPRAQVGTGEAAFDLTDGSIVIAAITSCTNTSNPSVMLAAGLLARRAVERGMRSKPWVKTSLAPGSQVVTEYLREAGLLAPLEALGFHVVGYGCTTCIGNSGPLPPEISEAIAGAGLVAVSVLSGNRNFEGRINPDVRANYLASPPLVVAYALAGRIDFDPLAEPLGTDAEGRPVFLREIWPSRREILDVVESSVRSEMFRARYASVFEGDARWKALPAPASDLYAWDPDSTYIREPPYFEDLPPEPRPVEDVRGARVLAFLGDSVTTDHISPAGSFRADTPAGRWLTERGVAPADFNSYGSRRGNHEVMARGTFANVRLRNRLAGGREGGFTRHVPSGEPMTIYDAAVRYAAEGVPLLVLAGREYGAGSSRDWAAKGPRLQGVRAVLAQSYERIHRSNLIGMGIAPLEFLEGESAVALGLTGEEVYAVEGLAAAVEAARGGSSARTADGGADRREVAVRVTPSHGEPFSFRARLRIDTPREADYYRHGGILQYVLRRLLATPAAR